MTVDNRKLDGVASLITDPPPTNSTTMSNYKKKNLDTYHMSPDT